MKKIDNEFSILAIALIFSIGVMSACISTSRMNSDRKDSAGGNEQTNVSANEKTGGENKSAENKASNEVSSKANAEGLPELKKGEDYAKSIRDKMLKAGWKPTRSVNADWCGGAEPTCDEFEEYESKTEKDLTNFRWAKGNKFVEISCSGGDRSYTFESYKFENNSTTIAQAERWNEFWAKFKAAMNEKDSDALKLMMTQKIDGGGAVETREERLDAIEQNNMWASMQKTVAEPTKTDKCDKPCRVTKDGYLVFTYETAIWKWSGLGGEGGED